MSKRPINVEVRPRYRDEPPEKMIRRFSKKVKKARIIEKFIEKKRYEKPSIKRKRERLRRKKVLDKLQRERENRFKKY
jgi:ribosomal protein S21|tara:strand:+ start:390 stop:623 length:234 start_codon:yes stop_codon:yes gene_type:complete